jgi:2-(1,2-epoxy-1,2-dihydrophenyl)acetyl-CoA isomerase
MQSSESTEARDYETIRFTIEDGVAQLALNRPERLNALNLQMSDECLDAIGRVKRDPALRVLVITGEGRAFCAGADVRSPGEIGTRRTAMEARDWLRELGQRLPLALQQLERPVIAAINGVAAGGGLDIACACDVRIAAESATFTSVFARIGLFPGTGGCWLLPRIVGIEKACELIWLGDSIDAAEALRIGLVGRVVPAEALLETALGLAQRLARAAPLAVRLSKAAIYRGLTQDFASALDYAATAESITLTSEDLQEGLIANRERRQPQFRGR